MSTSNYILAMCARHMLYSERQESHHPCVQPSACNTNSNVVCSTHTMLSQVLTHHCDIVSAHGSVRNQLSRATAARPVTHIHHRTSLFAACIIRNRYGDAPWRYVTGGTLELMDVRHRRTKEWPMILRNRTWNWRAYLPSRFLSRFYKKNQKCPETAKSSVLFTLATSLAHMYIVEYIQMTFFFSL